MPAVVAFCHVDVVSSYRSWAHNIWVAVGLLQGGGDRCKALFSVVILVTNWCYPSCCQAASL